MTVAGAPTRRDAYQPRGNALLQMNWANAFKNFFLRALLLLIVIS